MLRVWLMYIHTTHGLALEPCCGSGAVRLLDIHTVIISRQSLQNAE